MKAIGRQLYSPIFFATVFGVLVVLFLVLPIFIVVPMSFSETEFLTFPPMGFTLRWYEDIFTNDAWLRPAGFSFRVALLTAVFSTVMGTIAAYSLVRGRFFGRSAVRLLIVSPVIAPNIVIAVGLYFAFIRWGLWGTTLSFVLAHSLLCIPFVVLSVTAALERFDPDLELAAISLGASRLKAFWLVTLPSILPGVLSGAVFSFIISFDEAVISYFISTPRQSTLPRVMFQNIETQVRPDVAAISTVLVCVSLIIVFITVRSRANRGGSLLE